VAGDFPTPATLSTDPARRRRCRPPDRARGARGQPCATPAGRFGHRSGKSSPRLPGFRAPSPRSACAAAASSSTDAARASSAAPTCPGEYL